MASVTIEEMFNDQQLPVEERAILGFLHLLDFCEAKHVHAANAFTIALQRKLDENKKQEKFNSIIK